MCGRATTDHGSVPPPVRSALGIAASLADPGGGQSLGAAPTHALRSQIAAAGQAARFSTLTRICDVLDCQPGDLFSLSPPTEASSAPDRPMPRR
ncbi:MAG: helix-turn-helix domain-containing protein [Acidimicrobiales bacterium]